MRMKLLVAAAFAAAVAAIVVPSASAAGPTECNSFYSNTTFKGGLVVNEGDLCILDHVTVNGGLQVNGGAFSIVGVTNSTIHGGWSMTGTVLPAGYFCGNNVDGGLNVSNVEAFGEPLSFGELNADCAGGTINGGATFQNDDGAVELDGYRVNGSLNMAGVAGFYNELEATAVKGSANCANVIDDGTSAPLVNSFTGPNNGCPT